MGVIVLYSFIIAACTIDSIKEIQYIAIILNLQKYSEKNFRVA